MPRRPRSLTFAFAALVFWAGCDDGDGAGAGDATGPRDVGVTDGSELDARAEVDARHDLGPHARGEPPDGPRLDAEPEASPDALARDGAWPDAAETSPDAGAPPPLYDLVAIADADTADCRFERHREAARDGVALDVWDLSYTSWELRGGALEPIRMRGFAARPVGARGLPGVVQAHGLGGFSEARQATGLAARLGMFVAVYTGPGGGTDATNTSEGLPAGHDDGRRMFDTVPDVRGSWFWSHTLAAR